MVQGTKSNKWVGYGLVVTLLVVFSMTASAGFWDDGEVELAPKEKVKRFLPGCHQFGHEFVDGRLVFKPVKTEEYDQTLYFIHNVHNDHINVKFQRTEGTELYPLWRTEIRVNRWAAFATDIQGLTFRCYEDYGDDTGRPVSCKRAVEVCQYPRAKFGENNRGNYWVSTNHSKKGLRNKVIRKGVLLRW